MPEKLTAQARVLSILALILASPARGVGLAELEIQTKQARSSLLRDVEAMIETGFVCKAEDGRLRPSEKILILFGQAVRDLDAAAQAYEIKKQQAERLKNLCLIGA